MEPQHGGFLVRDMPQHFSALQVRIFSSSWYQELEFAYVIPLVNRAEILSEDFLQRIPILGHSIGRIRNCLRHFFAPFLAYDIGGIRASLAPSRAYVIGGIRDVSLQILAPLLAKVISLKVLLSLICMMFSCFRLSFQGFGDTTQSHQDINLNPVLSLFYGLVLVQAVLSFFEFAHSYPSLDLTGINAHYKFTGSRDKQLELYYVHVRTLCRGGDIRKIINMTLISFAVESLGSDERDLHSAGIKILHSLIHTQLHDYSREQALSRIQNSPDVIEHLFKVITRTRIEDRPERARATLIIAKLAGNLCVSGFPYAMHSLRSLLETSDEDAIVTEESNNVDVNLVLKGLEILQQLACNTCNFTAISNADEIMLKITKFTRYNPAMTAIDFEKARNSLQLLSRLAGNIGKQGAMIRQVISNNVFLLSKIREILLQDPTNDQQLEGLQSLAVKIIESFALDSKAGTCKTITGILTLLLDIFSESLPPVSDLGLNAGKALGKLTMESRTHCDVILNTEGNLQTLRNMLFNEEQHTDYRVTVANILKNLVAYGETTNIVRDFAVTNLKMVVNRANETQGADLEAYLSLVVELSKLKPATNFNIALVFADCPTFVGKLIETVAEANIADDRCPGIRRLAVEQAIWMMRHDDDLRCKQHFVGMQACLQGITETSIENYKLIFEDIPVLEYEESLSYLVKTALQMIQG